jgi:hypothetical protein
MTEEDFIQRIAPSIQNIITVFNAILDDAENHGFFPKDELYILEEKKKQLLKEYDDAPEEEKLEKWQTLGDISTFFKECSKKTYSSIEDLWLILGSLEEFWHRHIAKDEDEINDNI